MIRNQTDTIVIRPKTSRAFIYSMIAIGFVVFVASVAGTYLFGRWQLNEQLTQAQKELGDQKQKYTILDERYEQMQESFVQMKRQLHIDDSAYSALRDELEESSAQLAELGRELKFYRSIIAPQEGQEGVRVQELAITPTEDPRRFDYRLVLIQTLQDGKELSATVGLTIKGKSGDEAQVVRHPGPGAGELRVKFKYFQNLRGTLELPQEFTPLEIRIDLAGDKKKGLLEERWYPWPEITPGKTS